MGKQGDYFQKGSTNPPGGKFLAGAGLFGKAMGKMEIKTLTLPSVYGKRARFFRAESKPPKKAGLEVGPPNFFKKILPNPGGGCFKRFENRGPRFLKGLGLYGIIGLLELANPLLGQKVLK